MGVDIAFISNETECYTENNNGKISTVVKLIIVSCCNSSLRQENDIDFIENKMADFHYQTFVCVTSLT